MYIEYIYIYEYFVNIFYHFSTHLVEKFLLQEPAAEPDPQQDPEEGTPLEEAPGASAAPDDGPGVQALSKRQRQRLRQRQVVPKTGGKTGAKSEKVVEAPIPSASQSALPSLQRVANSKELRRNFEFL